jgi:predicted SprT family Zn-dependent metalloprotease
MCSDHRRGHSEDLTVNVIRNEVCHIELHFLYKIEHDHDKMLKMHLLLYYELQSRS